MTGVTVSLSTQGYAEYRELAQRLRQAGTKGKGLRAELRKKITEAGKPVLAEVQEAVRTLPVTSHGGGTAQRTTHAVAEATRRAEARIAAQPKPKKKRKGLFRRKARQPETQTRKRRQATVGELAQRAARRPHGLRESVARATKLQTTVKGVRFVINASQLPESQRSLPRHLDSPKGWRHPVFGNTDNWVHQEGRPYFAATISRRAPAFRRAALDAIDETNRKIEGGR